MFGVCCNNTAPETQPEEPKKEVNDALDAVVEDFPVEFALAGNCGFRCKPYIAFKIKSFISLVWR